MISPRVRRVVSLLSKLPGVGEKTAQRYLLHLMTEERGLAEELGRELVELRRHLCPCTRCGNIADLESAAHGALADTARATGETLCAICTDNKRDASLLCVVARVHDLLSIERAGAMRGRYFVLGKLLSPLEGVGPDELPLRELTLRIRQDAVTEVIVATPPSVDGEATALLLKRELAPFGLRLSRIASGVPHGGDLEFADPITMGRAFTGRQTL